MKGWHARDHGSVDKAQRELEGRFEKIRDRYVKKTKTHTYGIAPWWNNACSTAFTYKQRAFMHRFVNPSKYDSAMACCRRVQKIAFKRYQKGLKVRLESMDNSDRNFWKLAKEIAGLDVEKAGATPDVDDGTLLSILLQKCRTGQKIALNTTSQKTIVKCQYSASRLNSNEYANCCKELIQAKHQTE